MIAAGHSETEAQKWMRDIRTRLWSSHPLLQLRQDSFPVSLIDNVHSDISRLRGFYGQLYVDVCSGQLLLLEDRSGCDQARWHISTIKKYFCPKTVCKEDRDHILVLITFRSSSTGEGIFTFYSDDAKDILKRLDEARDIFISEKEHCESMGKAKQGSSNNSESKLKIVKPILSFFRKDSQSSSKNPSENKHKLKQERGRRKVLQKSASVMEKFEYGGEIGFVTENCEWQRPQEVKAVSNRDDGFPTNNLCQIPNSQSEFVKLCHNNRASIKQQCEKEDSTRPEQNSPSPPPPPPSNDSPSDNQNYKDILLCGEYHNFSRDLDFAAERQTNEDKKPENPTTDLQTLEQTIYNLSEKGLNSQDARNSFISVDSGRMSDIYAETSSSSVTSSTGHSNRLNSNASNCSGDSGTQMSLSSDYSTREKLLSTLAEKESPESEQVLLQNPHGQTVTTYRDEEYKTLGTCSLKDCLQSNKIYCCNNAMCHTTNTVPIYEHIQEEAVNLRTSSLRNREFASNRRKNEIGGDSPTSTPPPLPPRFATIRKSHTLPHNLSGIIEKTGKDICSYPGLEDGGTESPAKDISETVAQQSFSYQKIHIAGEEKPGKKNLVCHQGIADPSTQESPYSPSRRETLSRPRSRPATLTLGDRVAQRSLSQEGGGRRCPEFQSIVPNRNVARAKSAGPVAVSVPTTPDVPSFSTFLPGPMAETPNHPKFCTPEKQMCGTGKRPLRKWSLFSSTPQDLDYKSQGTPLRRGRSGQWYSNDGLVTPVSLGGRSPLITPSHSPFPSPSNSCKPSRCSLSRRQIRTTAKDPLPNQRIASLHNSTSMFSLNFSSPLRMRTPKRRVSYRGTMTNTPRLYHSIPRSCTIDSIMDPRGDTASKYTNPYKSDQESDGDMMCSDFYENKYSLEFMGKKKPITPFCDPPLEVSAPPNLRTMDPCRGIKNAACVQPSQQLSPLFVNSSKSLENLINEARQELMEEKKVAKETATGSDAHNIYMDMNKFKEGNNKSNRQNYPSDYLEMKKVQNYLPKSEKQ